MVRPHNLSAILGAAVINDQEAKVPVRLVEDTFDGGPQIGPPVLNRHEHCNRRVHQHLKKVNVLGTIRHQIFNELVFVSQPAGFAFHHIKVLDKGPALL